MMKKDFYRCTAILSGAILAHAGIMALVVDNFTGWLWDWFEFFAGI